MTTPVDGHQELVELVRRSLRDPTGSEPEEYGPSRFPLEVDDLDFTVPTTP